MSFEKSMVLYNQIDDMNFYRYDPEINQGIIIQDGELWGTYSFGSRDFIVVNTTSGGDNTIVLQYIISDIQKDVGVFTIHSPKDVLDEIQKFKSRKKDVINPIKRLVTYYRYTVRIEDTFLNIGKFYEG